MLVFGNRSVVAKKNGRCLFLSLFTKSIYYFVYVISKSGTGNERKAGDLVMGKIKVK